MSSDVRQVKFVIVPQTLAFLFLVFVFCVLMLKETFRICFVCEECRLTSSLCLLKMKILKLPYCANYNLKLLGISFYVFLIVVKVKHIQILQVAYS